MRPMFTWLGVVALIAAGLCFPAAASATAVPTTPPPMTHTPKERATGIEPALRAWKAPVQPQHFARGPTPRRFYRRLTGMAT